MSLLQYYKELLLELAAEMEECDETNAVEEDEEEADLDASIAACLEERPVVTGMRRSARLRPDMMRDNQLARLLQESAYDDFLQSE